jgi:hypothetical protein
MFCFSFWALHYAISRFGPEFSVLILANLLLLNEKVNSRMIEEFMCDRTDEEKEQARRILMIASDQWAHNLSVYQAAVLQVGRRSDANAWTFERFRENIKDLMIELRRGTCL